MKFKLIAVKQQLSMQELLKQYVLKEIKKEYKNNEKKN